MLIFVGLGAVGLFLTEQVFWEEWRWLGIIVGNLIFPVAAVVAAVYDGFANNDWTLALIAAASVHFFAIAGIVKRKQF